MAQVPARYARGLPVLGSPGSFGSGSPLLLPLAQQESRSHWSCGPGEQSSRLTWKKLICTVPLLRCRTMALRVRNHVHR